MCKCLSLSHIAKIHTILIKQTIFSKKVRKKEGRLDPPSHIETYRVTLKVSQLGIIFVCLPKSNAH